MYVPTHFREADRDRINEIIRATRLAQLVTQTAKGLIASPLPLHLVEEEGQHGTLYGHVARANEQWSLMPQGEALAIFMAADAYVSPSLYASKQQTHKVVPTWNYLTVHAYGEVSFFDDAQSLHNVVSQLTQVHEMKRTDPWSVGDAPETFIASQLGGIVGVRLRITRLEGKCKMSQNKSAADRAGVRDGLAVSDDEMDRQVAKLIPR